METLVKADIFFFISSISTIVLTVLICALLFYLIKASRNLHALTESLKEHYKDGEEFIADLKDRMEENVIFRMFFPPARKSRRSKMKDGNIKND